MWSGRTPSIFLVHVVWLRSQVRLMAMGEGRHMLPVKLEIRRAIGKEASYTVKVKLEKRIRN
jgi:hypothetical protein